MSILLAHVWTVVAPLVGDLAGVMVIIVMGLVTTAVHLWVKNIKDARLSYWAELLVVAAEQRLSSATGQDKYAWVATELNRRGLPADVAHIEAAVYDLKNGIPADWLEGISGASMVDN